MSRLDWLAANPDCRSLVELLIRVGKMSLPSMLQLRGNEETTENGRMF